MPRWQIVVKNVSGDGDGEQKNNHEPVAAGGYTHWSKTRDERRSQTTQTHEDM